jgi:hypothetical protein
VRYRGQRDTRGRGGEHALNEIDNYWWIVNGVPEDEEDSGFIQLRFVDEFSDWRKLRKHVWNIYRRHAGRRDINAAATLTLWAVCERYRHSSFSSRDAYSYYAKMIGLERRTVGRAITELIEKNVLWCVLENEKRMIKKAEAGKRKHLLLVGLGHSLRGG